eukprot:3682778-Amphidinium_carterae.4
MHPGWVQPAPTCDVSMPAYPKYKRSDLEWISDPACGYGWFSGPVGTNRIFDMLEPGPQSICGSVTVMNDTPSTTVTIGVSSCIRGACLRDTTLVQSQPFSLATNSVIIVSVCGRISTIFLLSFRTWRGLSDAHAAHKALPEFVEGDLQSRMTRTQSTSCKARARRSKPYEEAHSQTHKCWTEQRSVLGLALGCEKLSSCMSTWEGIG